MPSGLLPGLTINVAASKLRWMRMIRVDLPVVILALAGSCLAAAPTTAVSDDAAAPRAMLHAADALAGAGPEAYLRFYQVNNGDQQRMAQSETRVDAQFGMMQLLVEKKWGASAADDITHALGGYTTADEDAADLTIDGDHATVAWKDGSTPLKMIRVNGQWKIDLGATLQLVNESPDQYVENFRRMSGLLADLADAIDADKFKTAAQATDDAKHRIAAMWESTDATSK
jgi:hypothetical protein